jgi:hypothetical protein
MYLSSAFYILLLFLFVFGIFNGASRDEAVVKKSALKAIALVVLSLLIVVLVW